eukprot:TRINITY_DN1527_c0_g1_i1.p1 TRINITY_DN1527_c0_g1~~TRINITY_DN1527_c0_g1_i1.p1  ORF type:complete len:196 (+),score=19.74 TRINITY_DN1527_c0_g1_i1:16-603(+)
MSKRSGESLEQERPQKKRCEKELDPPPMTLRLLDEEWRTLEEEFRSVKPLSACSKDRFVDIAPVRETLCVLNGGSYINANRVELEGLSFVATQEPLPVNFSPELTETENDFWSLIWEQKIGIIVGLTRNELSYLPQKQQIYGELLVNLQEDKWIADFPIHIRYYTIRPEANKSDEVLSVVHIHFLHWPGMFLRKK